MKIVILSNVLCIRYIVCFCLTLVIALIVILEVGFLFCNGLFQVCFLLLFVFSVVFFEVISVSIAFTFLSILEIPLCLFKDFFSQSSCFLTLGYLSEQVTMYFLIQYVARKLNLHKNYF